jgi:hypothetical protein
MRLAAASAETAPLQSFEQSLLELADRASAAVSTDENWSTLHTTRGLQLSEIGTCDSASNIGSAGYTDDDDMGETQAISNETDNVASAPIPTESNGSRSFQFVLLEAREGRERVVIGGLVLDASAREVGRLRKGLLRGIAQVLHARPFTSALDSAEAMAEKSDISDITP